LQRFSSKQRRRRPPRCGRLRERRLELARRVSQAAGPLVAELAEVLRDLQFLAEPAATDMAQRALLAGPPATASTPQPVSTG
jgi:hypothetical protein